MKKITAFTVVFVLILSLLSAGNIFAAPVADENIALGKPVKVTASNGEYDPAAVVDGDINTMWAGPAATNNVAVIIDLEQTYIITSVLLYNRNDITTEQYRRNVNIEFSNTPDFSVCETVVAMGNIEAPFGVPVEVTPPSKTPYRYVRAIKTNNTTHVVNEIEVYGYIEDPNEVKLGTDVPGTDYEGPVTLLRYLGLIDLKKPDDELFCADFVMTRGEAAKLVVQAFGGKNSFTGGIPFVDVPENHKYYDAIRDAYYLSYVQGSSGTMFRPDEHVTKIEFLFMTMRAIGYSEIIQKAFDNRAEKVIAQ
ncbi:MAG: discoidin domain-containing protein, partial [Clostridia bacterium]